MLSFVPSIARLRAATAREPGARATIASLIGLAEANAMAVTISALNAVLFAAGAAGRVDSATLLAWLITSLGLLAALRLRSRAALPRMNALDPQQPLSHRAILRVIGYAALTAAPWAALPFLFFGRSDPVVDVLILMVCAGMSAGGATTQHSIPEAAATFFGVILGAVVVVCVGLGLDQYWAIAAFTLPYGAALWMTAASTSRMARERETSLRRAGEALAELQDANDALDRLRGAAERDALRDELTGLANRRGLQRELARRAARPGPCAPPIAVLHLDLDRFKQINDALGHAAGDFVLRQVADRLRRETDAGDFVARIGGDEFVVATDLGDDRQRLEAMAARLIRALREPVSYGGETCYFGASIGIDRLEAGAAGREHDLGALLANADLALYRAKQSGRGRHHFFTQTLRDEAQAQKSLGDELIAALEKGEFEPVYQTQHRAGDRSLAGVEALARWRHPSRGVLAPGVFLPVAERLGATARIDHMILEQALRDLARWDAAGLHMPRLAVNVSASRLHDPDLLTELRGLDIPAGRLSFEILESVFSDHVDETLHHILDWLDEAGIAIELDDFGTGHTSLISMLNFRPRRIKIARELAAGLQGSAERRTLVAAFVGAARRLGMEIVGEGVETEEDAGAMEAVGCGVLQGYFFCRPIDAETLLRRHGPRDDARAESAG